MAVDIDGLTEPELVDLNRRIVERLRLLQQMRAHKQMLAFKIGDRVAFQADGRGAVEGMLVLSGLAPTVRFGSPGTAGSFGTGGDGAWMDCVCCGSAAVTERPERTARGYRRFRCRGCGKQFSERSAGLLNRAQYPSDVIALVVLWRLRYRLMLRDLAEMFLVRGITFSHEAVRDWEAKLAPVLAGELRRRRHGGGGARGRHWHVARHT